MLEALTTALRNQFNASLYTLNQCIAQCPAELWFERVGNDPYWYVVYHTLYFVDFYLERDERSFRPRAFHREDEDLLGPPPWPSANPPGREAAYTQALMGEYVRHCRQKAVAAVGAETSESLAGPSGFTRRNITRLELHVYNIRHIQHHAAQLSLRLRSATGEGIEWRSTGWPADRRA